MTKRPRLRQLEALKSVVDHGSMTRAAQSLKISQPAVSRLLADLSDELGFALLSRKDGRLVPTQEAGYILPDIARVLGVLKNITETSQNVHDKTSGHLSITCLPGFATSHMPAVVTNFLKTRPDVTITLEPDRPERILEWIVGEQYDCGITDGFDGHPAIESTMLSVRTVCIFPKGHRFTDLEQVDARQLNEERFVHTRRDSSFYRALNDVFRQASVRPTHVVETRQFTAACELVAQGVGVSVVSELDARTYEDRLDFRPFVPSVPHKICLVRPIHKRPSKITLDFMEDFKASLSTFEV
ncbi:LysR substrate-binding domain-containing protein [Loktanella sp. Alg231-35]|uniref:LysR substrate-binding domain-containing protein n=1 Tax=Loktanella sp. Alg231-35 TaxID=1922220 RepID=UPI000D55613D|nr:LysR substrate-binding domain-containing protein [Loktanella sp. Alg231-35]